MNNGNQWQWSPLNSALNHATVWIVSILSILIFMVWHFLISSMSQTLTRFECCDSGFYVTIWKCLILYLELISVEQCPIIHSHSLALSVEMLKILSPLDGNTVQEWMTERWVKVGQRAGFWAHLLPLSWPPSGKQGFVMGWWLCLALKHAGKDYTFISSKAKCICIRHLLSNLPHQHIPTAVCLQVWNEARGEQELQKGGWV